MGSFLGPFPHRPVHHTKQLPGYAYVHVCDLQPTIVDPGHIWIRNKSGDEFNYRYDPAVLSRYISINPGERAKGILMDFVESRKRDFERVFGFLYASRPETYSPGSFVSRYAVVKGETSIGENVLVAQRAYLQNAKMGKGANAQENSYVVDSVLNLRLGGPRPRSSAPLGSNVRGASMRLCAERPEAPLSYARVACVAPHHHRLVEPVELPPACVWVITPSRTWHPTTFPSRISPMEGLGPHRPPYHHRNANASSGLPEPAPPHAGRQRRLFEAKASSAMPEDQKHHVQFDPTLLEAVSKGLPNMRSYPLSATALTPVPKKCRPNGCRLAAASPGLARFALKPEHRLQRVPVSPSATAIVDVELLIP
jgi:hypothetical protein